MEKETIIEELKRVPAEPVKPQCEEPYANGKTAGVRTASKEQFEKAHRKTSETHAGLFRRLAK